MSVLDSTFLIDLNREESNAVDVLQELRGRGRPLRVPAVVMMEVATGEEEPEEAASELESSFLIQPFTPDLAVVGATVARNLFEQGVFPGWTDVMIAATALHFGEELVSRNERHFRRVSGLELRTY